jgi:uncharacterized OB-fold protein
MALIKCPECGKQISDKAEVCPHCGVEARKELAKNREKRSIIIAIISACVVAAIAIGAYLH